MHTGKKTSGKFLPESCFILVVTLTLNKWSEIMNEIAKSLSNNHLICQYLNERY